MFRAIYLLVLASILRDCLAQSLGSAGPIPPSQDPWYTAPANFEHTAPGTVLRVRAVPGNLTGAIANISAAYNILYRTTDSRYKPAWAVTTLLVPKRPLTGLTGATALLTYLVPYDTADVDYSPSFALPAYAASGVVTFQEIQQGVSSGWYVSVPDYEGPLASYTAGVLAGHSTIDSVRAVLSAGFGLANSPDVKYALWGYSGGALAGEWAAELQVQYAPELSFSGIALGGLTPDIMSVFRACTGSACAAQIAPATVGLTTQFPEFDAYIRARLKTTGPQNATTFFSVQTASPLQVARTFAFQDIAGYFIGGAGDLYNPIASKVYNSDGRMGYHGVPTAPMFFYKSINDEYSPVNETDALVAKYCDVGATIQYERNTIGTHAQGLANGHASALAFLTKGLSQSYVPPVGCSIKNTSFNASATLLKRQSRPEPLSLLDYMT